MASEGALGSRRAHEREEGRRRTGRSGLRGYLSLNASALRVSPAVSTIADEAPAWALRVRCITHCLLTLAVLEHIAA